MELGTYRLPNVTIFSDIDYRRYDPMKVLPCFITTKQAAAIAGVTERTVRNRIHDGKIKSTTIGRSRRIYAQAFCDDYQIPVADVLRVLNGMEV